MCCTQVQLAASLAAVNRYATRKSFPSEYYIRRIRKETAEKTFNLLTYSQKQMLSKLCTDLTHSKEYTWNDVLVYAVIRWYNLDKLWQFDVVDQYVMVKENLKKISGIFDKKRYIKDVEMLLAKVEASKISVSDLLKIQSDGTSFLYKLYTDDLVGLKVVSLFADAIEKGSNESDQHVRFRRMALIIKQIEDTK